MSDVDLDETNRRKVKRGHCLAARPMDQSTSQRSTRSTPVQLGACSAFTFVPFFLHVFSAMFPFGEQYRLEEAMHSSSLWIRFGIDGGVTILPRNRANSAETRSHRCFPGVAPTRSQIEISLVAGVDSMPLGTDRMQKFLSLNHHVAYSIPSCLIRHAARRQLSYLP
jgi:hypothetical protein